MTRVAPRPLALASLRCECGSVDVMAVSPGSDEDRPGDLFLVARGVPAVGWCLGCMTRRGWLMAEAAA